MTSPGPGRRDNVQLIHRAIREDILAGRLAPGTEISQVRVAATHGVSRGPVREALRLLEREGLIYAEPNRRVVVTPFSWADIEELCALQIVTDGLALRVSLPRLSDAELEVIGTTLDELDGYGEREDIERWLEAHGRFHRLLVQHGGRRLTRASSELLDHAEHYRRVYLRGDAQPWTAISREHHDIYEACLRRDADTAVEQLARHRSRGALTALATHAPTYDPALVREALLDATRGHFPEARPGHRPGVKVAGAVGRPRGGEVGSRGRTPPTAGRSTA
jgi:DNA-binding GntR family transcriptional regulator